MNKLKLWFYKVFLGRTYTVSVDLSASGDYSCWTYGYWKNDVLTITDIKFEPPTNQTKG